MKILKEIYKILYNIIRGLCRFSIRLIILLFVWTIFLITYEPNKKKTITVRKARRIRILSKFKIFALNLMPDCMASFLGFEKYKNYLNTHLKNGLQLRVNRAN